MKYYVVPVDVNTMNDADWKKFHAFRKKFHDETDPEDPFEADEAYQQLITIKANHPEQTIHVHFVENEIEEMIGLFGIAEFKKTSASYENMKHLVFLLMDILPEYRFKGIENDLLKRIHQYGKENSKRTLLYSAWEDKIKQNLSELGFESALSNIINRLNLEKLDWSMVNGWITISQERNQTTRILVFEEIPDDILVEYTKILGETMNQIPRGSLDFGDIIYTPENVRQIEKDRKNTGRQTLNVVTIEPSGEISGLTWLTYAQSKEIVLGQGLTSVQEKHRGRGLGKWLKAVALVEAKKTFPKAKYIDTSNATTNAPMLAINNQLGFHEHKVYVNFQISIEKLEQNLLASNLPS